MHRWSRGGCEHPHRLSLENIKDAERWGTPESNIPEPESESSGSLLAHSLAGRAAGMLSTLQSLPAIVCAQPLRGVGSGQRGRCWAQADRSDSRQRQRGSRCSAPAAVYFWPLLLATQDILFLLLTRLFIVVRISTFPGRGFDFLFPAGTASSPNAQADSLSSSHSVPQSLILELQTQREKSFKTLNPKIQHI